LKVARPGDIELFNRAHLGKSNFAFVELDKDDYDRLLDHSFLTAASTLPISLQRHKSVPERVTEKRNERDGQQMRERDRSRQQGVKRDRKWDRVHERDRERDSERDSERDFERDRERELERDSERDRERDREREPERDREREPERGLDFERPRERLRDREPDWTQIPRFDEQRESGIVVLCPVLRAGVMNPHVWLPVSVDLIAKGIMPLPRTAAPLGGMHPYTPARSWAPAAPPLPPYAPPQVALRPYEDYAGVAIAHAAL
jgi:hypothetical protein